MPAALGRTSLGVPGNADDTGNDRSLSSSGRK
jgi:hypothetical protein